MKVCGQTEYRTRDLWLFSQTCYQLRYAARHCVWRKLYHDFKREGKQFTNKRTTVRSTQNKVKNGQTASRNLFQKSDNTFHKQLPMCALMLLVLVLSCTVMKLTVTYVLWDCLCNTLFFLSFHLPTKLNNLNIIRNLNIKVRQS